ncbi:hypothetical protein EER27_14100 [Lysobacter psychrotolerans]|uniref:Uncharacterized protein n=2 Tax=Montanilutibacter psychrotolerans TaxID=1327343 RepID=A0A3M8SUU4_9GAMM|nr:hypothetical protein EER27_14100 [Lysobacter psychrotolerans]
MIYFLLALFGCDMRGGNTIVSRATVDGVDIVHSETRVTTGMAWFECITSASGNCHYRLFRVEAPQGGCAAGNPASTMPACTAPAFAQFVVAAGKVREMAGLPAVFRPCVSHQAGSVMPDCMPVASASAAARRPTP